MTSIYTQLKDKADGVYIDFKRIVERDEFDNTPPDKRDDGYWPSLNPHDAGFIGEDKTAGDLVRATEAAQSRYDEFMRGEWWRCGVKARAVIHHKTRGSVCTYTLESAGIWGVESDCDESALAALFESEKSELRGLILALRSAQELTGATC